MERTPSTPYSRAGGLAALGGSMLVAGSMFLPWADAGGGTVNFWGLSGLVDGDGDTRTYGLSVALIPLLVLWCALFFAWRTHETRMAWAFGGFTGAMVLYGGDLRISEDLAASAHGAGEVVAAVGLLLLASGCVLALAANIPEPVQSRTDWKGSL
ncbi:hypothetical protein ACFQS3_24130 [Glycomyces mayteni]|uniref:Uncharacterized protein n=2 Tax=Glycomyces mayteni TaxID=543887 RepID=A0ABW2DGC0_9ACTN|nr:hypothetical protein GCM10025732_41120 [Glycomyces mayteni]